MNKREILKMLLSGTLLPDQIPAIGEGHLLIQTSETGFTDAKTGERFTSDQVEKMKTPFAGSPWLETQICGERNMLLDDTDCHKNARKPFLTKTEISGRECYMYSMIFIPEVKSIEDQIHLATSTIKNRQ